MTKLFKVIIELYELLITSRKDDRSGRVVSTRSLKINDLQNNVYRSGKLARRRLQAKSRYAVHQNTLLKEPRTYVFEYVLACNIPTA